MVLYKKNENPLIRKRFRNLYAPLEGIHTCLANDRDYLCTWNMIISTELGGRETVLHE